MKSNSDIFKELPDDSLIRQKCSSLRRGFFYKSKEEKGCNHIKDMLVAASGPTSENKFHSGVSVGGLFGEGARLANILILKEKIRDILPEESDAIKWKEYEEVTNTYSFLGEKVIAKEAEERTKRKEEERNNRKIPKF